MGAKTACKKGYNTKEGYVEFKEGGNCPVGGVSYCELCQAKVFQMQPPEEER